GAQLFRIYLLPTYIGRGIGSGLLQRGEAFLRDQGVDSYFCYVHKDNELGKRFYLRQGFVHRAGLDRDDEWYMEKRLS
ncbi:MAG: GNAT family N-acetyltransferase, partial [Roseiflexaceae bacterium]|nr:GNAT family N-acetyltransferase [Roseiflexaceae bacterium]